MLLLINSFPSHPKDRAVNRMKYSPDRHKPSLSVYRWRECQYSGGTVRNESVSESEHMLQSVKVHASH